MIEYKGYENLNASNPMHCIASKIMKSHRIINNIFRKHLKPFGITNSQMSILFILSKKGNVNQAELSQILFMEKSTVNRNLKRLIEDKIVSKAAFPQISITKNGLDLLESIIPYWEAAMEEAKQKLQPNGVSALNTLMNNLSSN